MSRHYPPKCTKDIVVCLEILGFVKKQRLGKGKHPYKYFHPSKIPNREKYPKQSPFIIIPSHVNETQIRYILKEMESWEFSEDDVKQLRKC